MTRTYRVLVNGDVRMTFTADFDQASSPLTMDGRPTPFQVADARHHEREAAELLNEWCGNEGGEAWADDEKFIIEDGE